MKRPLLLLAAAVLLAACNLNVDPQFRVKDVRILAVRARVAQAPLVLADVYPGDTVLLDALVANPLGRAGLTVSWFACLPPASDAVTPCADVQTLRDPTRLVPLATGPNPTVLALPPGPSTQLAIPPLSAPLAWAIQRAVEQPTYACRMYQEIVVVVVAEAEGKREVAVKTVRVKPPSGDITGAGVPDLYVLNHDPAIGDVFRAPLDADACAGGAPLAASPFPPGRTVVCATAQDRSIEQYAVCDPDGVTSRDESLGFQWYVTDGDFPKVGGVGNATGDHLDFDRPPGPFTLWTILRDGRGGDDWVTVAVSAQ